MTHPVCVTWVCDVGCVTWPLADLVLSSWVRSILATGTAVMCCYGLISINPNSTIRQVGHAVRTPMCLHAFTTANVLLRPSTHIRAIQWPDLVSPNQSVPGMPTDCLPARLQHPPTTHHLPLTDLTTSPTFLSPCCVLPSSTRPPTTTATDLVQQKHVSPGHHERRAGEVHPPAPVHRLPRTHQVCTHHYIDHLYLNHVQ